MRRLGAEEDAHGRTGVGAGARPRVERDPLRCGAVLGGSGPHLGRRFYRPAWDEGSIVCRDAPIAVTGVTETCVVKNPLPVEGGASQALRFSLSSPARGEGVDASR